MKKQNPIQKLMAVRGMASVLTAFAGVIILMIIFAFMNANFISKTNLMSLLRSICPYLLVGIGQGIVCITGNIDLSIGSVLGMSAMISATLICNGVNPILALVIDLVACLLVGIVNGILVGKFKLPPFIGTLGTMTICRGIAQIVNGNYNTGDIGTAPLATAIRNLFYYGKVGVIYDGVILTTIIWAVFNYIMSYTRTGRHIYAIGSNVDAAQLSGVDVYKTTTIAYLISAFCSCVAGIITMAAAGMGSMQAGMSYEMYGVAAAVIGGISTLGERQYSDGDNSKAQELANTLIANGVVAIYGTNDGATNGAASAVADAASNGTTVYCVGWDKSDSNIAHVESGSLSAFMAQNPDVMGEMAIEAVVSLENGEDLGGETVDTGVSVVDASNVEEFK